MIREKWIPISRYKSYWNGGGKGFDTYQGESITFDVITSAMVEGAHDLGYRLYAFDNPPGNFWIITPFGGLGSSNVGNDAVEIIPWDPPGDGWTETTPISLFDWSDVDDSGIIDIHFGGMSVDGSSYLYFISGSYSLYNYTFKRYQKEMDLSGSIIPVCSVFLSSLVLFLADGMTVSRKRKTRKTH